LSRMDDESVILDLDENNHPVRVQGREQITQYFGGLEKAIKTQGVRFDSKMSRNDCVASPTFGYCVIEFDQTMSVGGQTTPPAKFRATIVSRKVGDGWRWTHYHGSFREIPAPPPSNPPAASAALK